MTAILSSSSLGRQVYRCSYFVDTKLPLASGGICITLRGHIFPLLGVYLVDFLYMYVLLLLPSLLSWYVRRLRLVTHERLTKNDTSSLFSADGSG